MPIDPIEELQLTDTFAAWYLATNQLIVGYNDISIHTAIVGNGITIDSGTNGDTTFSVNLATNSGLVFYPDKSLGIDIFTLPEDTEVNDDDYFLLEAYSDDEDNNGNELKKVKAKNILSLNIDGNHIFSNTDTDSYISFETENLFLNSQNILVENSYITLRYVLDTNGNFLSKDNITAGLRIVSNSDVVTFEYNGSVDAWLSSVDLGFSSGSKFINVADNSGDVSDATFTFGLIDTQTAVSLRIEHGSATNDEYWSFSTDPLQDSLHISLIDENTDGESQHIIRLSKLTAGEGGGGLLYINDKIFIGNITGSSQFKTEPTSIFASYMVPLSNADGILDYRWANRYVATEIEGTISEGDIVRFTTDTDSVRIVRADATSEENSNFIGIVERIYNGKYYIVLSGQFNASSSIDLSLTFGETYYLSGSAGDVTATKPTGIAKPVLIATGNKTGILLTQGNGQLPLFKDVYIVDEDSTLSPAIVDDTLSFRGGTGIGIRLTTDNEVEIYSSDGPGTQFAYSQINGVSTNTSTGNIEFSGMNGITIQVAQNFTNTEVEIEAPNGFGIIDVISNSTDDNEFTLDSGVSNATLELIAGTGITLINHTENGMTIEATGVSVPAVGSVSNTILSNMGPYTIKGSDEDGNPIDVSLNNFLNYYLSTDNVFYIENPVTLIYEAAYGEEPGNGGVPGSIAGFVIGRIVDINGDVSGVTALNRSDLRTLLGVSPTGYLEENQNAYSIIGVVDGLTTTSLEAANQTDILTLQAGTGISLSASENTDGSSVVVISANSASYFASLGSGFNTIIVPEGSFNSGDSDAVIEIPETDTILAEFGTTDSNFDLLLNVKTNSITNSHLTTMPANTVKVGLDTTDGGNIDLLLEQNTLLGRLDGEVQALTTEDLNTLLEDTFFDSIVIEKTNGSTIVVNPYENSGDLRLVEGSYITLNKTGDGEITISSSAPAAYGIRTIQTSDDSISRSASSVILESPSQNYELLAGNIDLKPTSSTSRQYKNIKLAYSYNTITKSYKAIFDLEGMPASTVKCAGTDLDGYGNFIPTNVYLNTNQILGRKSGNNYVSGIDPLYFKDLVGIYSYRTVNITNESTDSNDDSIQTSSTNSSFTLMGGENITITKEDASTIKIDATNVLSSLSEDTSPQLGGNLNVNNRTFRQNNKNILAFSNSSSTGDFSFSLNATTTPTIQISRNSGSTASSDLILTPYGAGYVQIQGGLLSASVSNSLTLRSGTGTFNLTNSSSAENILYSPNTTNIWIQENEKLNLSFDTTNSRDMTIERVSDEVRAYTSTASGNNLVLGSKYNGSTSTGTIYLRGIVDIDSDYYITNTSKSINVDGEFSIFESDTFGVSTSNSVRFKKEKIDTSSYLSPSLTGIPADASAVIYDILIIDNNNVNIRRMITLKILSTDIVGSSDGNYANKTYNERLSELASSNTAIKSLYFTKNSTTLDINSSVGGSIDYTIHSLMTIMT